MEPIVFCIIIVAALMLILGGGVVAMNIITRPIAAMVTRTQFTRPEGDEIGWKRGECSFPDNEENMEMHRQGMAWAEANEDFKKEVSITSYDGLKLCGQYFDFGFKKAVLFSGGRAEACTYGYYFVMPYKEWGYNVLVVDNRAHGLSEGKHTYAAMKECYDLQSWTKYLNTELGNVKVLLHGVCNGSAALLRSLAEPGAADCVEGLIVDGIYTYFYETLRTHFIALGKPVFPVCGMVANNFNKLSGHNVRKEGPKKDILKYTGPLLMIHGKEDTFSLPKYATEMYESSPSSNKRLVWFDHGMHSHLKIVAPEKYDATVKEFLDTL